MRKLLVTLAGLVFAMALALPAVAAVDSGGDHIGNISKMVTLDKAYAHADVASVAPAAQKIANDAHLESNPKIAMAVNTGTKPCMASCNTKSERLWKTQLNL